MKKLLTAMALGSAILTGANAALAQDTTTEATTETATAPAAQSTEMKMPNPFDSSTWFDGAGHVPVGHVERFNPVDPDSWMKFVNPKTHTKMHATFTNPAAYAQFMNPGLYVQMMNPQVWMKWMNPASYQVLIEPTTYTYWMQPGAYTHAMEPTHYMQMINPEAYTKLMEDSMKEATSSSFTTGSFNFFDPMAWVNAFSQGTASLTNQNGSADQG